MKFFRIKRYEITSEKITAPEGITFAFLTDLHGVQFGRGNQALLEGVDSIHPDGVLIAGDMFANVDLKTYKRAYHLVKILARRYPVYYALGNHEYKMFLNEEIRHYYFLYERKLKERGVVFLRNSHETVTVRGVKVCLHGLELPVPFYRKPRSPKLSMTTMRQLVGRPQKGAVNVLLAHNPKYGNTYLNWGADLILSGHYHGGVMRLTEHVGMSSPQYLLFPPYCCGDFHRGASHMIVSAGLGEHTVPIRIHNPRELLAITMKPPAEK